ncbi:MAG: HAMP domain-containing sensor histidine kinase [Cyanobacteriota bacterium]|nr:HAMP domain-containing sensor histidine kinase [Cyanobacteriota bacterium]
MRWPRWPAGLDSLPNRLRLSVLGTAALGFVATATALVLVEQPALPATPRLLLVCSLGLGLTLLALALALQRTLRPLRQLERQAAAIHCDDPSPGRITLASAPRDLKALAGVTNALVEQLASRGEQQHQFVSAVSHELRTPLTIISGYLRRLQRRGSSLEPEQIRALATAEAETLRMNRMLNDLLDICRSSSGRLQLLVRPVAVDEIVLMACDLSRTLMARRLELRLPPGGDDQPVLALAEADRLQQVVLNLIENADKYTPDPSAIVVELARERRADGGGEIRVSIIDRGIGIPPEDLPNIFRRFHRAANALEQARGSGLGLSIVQLLVEAMGGRISVDSVLGQGSRFHLHLPAVEEPGRGGAALSTVPAPAGPRQP